MVFKTIFANLICVLTAIIIVKAECHSAQNNTIPIEKFGALGDGIHDDSEALMKAIKSNKRILLSNKTYLINSNIYLFGKASIIGDKNSEIKIDEDLSKCDGRNFWFSIGVTDKGGKVVPWTGSIENVKFTATQNATFNYCLNLFNSDHVRIINCTFDWTHLKVSEIKGDPRGISIESINNSDWCTKSSTRNLTISGNTILHNEDVIGAEGIGISNGINITISDNFIWGVADDPIAVHNVDSFYILNNKCFTTHGRIMMENSRNGLVQNNYIQRVPRQIRGGYNGGGALCMIDVGMKYSKTYKPENIIITNNYFKLPRGIPSPTYMLRALGVKNCTITNNKFECNTSQGVSAIEVGSGNIKLAQRNKAIMDMGELALREYISPSNYIVRGNQSTGEFLLGIYETGPKINFKGSFFYDSNKVKDYRIISDGKIISK